MIELVKDPKEVERLAAMLDDENIKFREFLKWKLKWSDKKLDALFRETSAWVAEQIDCTACAACCRESGTGVDEEDIKRLACRLIMTTEDFEAAYVTQDRLGKKVMSQTPCPFLDGCLCSIYNDRPTNCREFPYLDKEDMRSRSLGLLANASLCPIVFNTLEVLKLKLDWRKPRRR